MNELVSSILQVLWEPKAPLKAGPVLVVSFCGLSFCQILSVGIEILKSL